MTLVVPHEETIHNRLEYFNELCLITMQYMMIFFISGSDLDPEFQWEVGKAVMSLVGLVFVTNVIALIYLTVCRIVFWCRVRKARQAYLKVKVRRGAIKLSSSKSLALKQSAELNEARDIEQMLEDIAGEGSIMIPIGNVNKEEVDPNNALLKP